MILNVYSFFDTKAQMFSTPFFAHRDGEAVRIAVDLGEDLGTRIGRHPEDYILYRIGAFEDQSAVLSAATPESFGPVAGMLRPKPVNGLFDPVALKEVS